ncbi:alpha/beta fold hydrolase [Micromonospora sp. NPDC049801]|uniref:alpha/beta fold hydrolase n=1 Tax=Micromonospora sp. NPDC049801 TaxID=3155509 RepID=UPI0033EF6759
MQALRRLVRRRGTCRRPVIAGRVCVLSPERCPRSAIDIRVEIGRAVREALYGDVDAATADSAIDLLAPAAPVGIAADAPVVTRERYGSVPKTYVVCTKENAVPPAPQRRLIAEIDAVSTSPTQVIELDSAHSPMLSHPDDLPAAIGSAGLG